MIFCYVRGWPLALFRLTPSQAASASTLAAIRPVKEESVEDIQLLKNRQSQTRLSISCAVSLDNIHCNKSSLSALARARPRGE